MRRNLNFAFDIQHNRQNTTPIGANQVLNFQKMRRNTTITSFSPQSAPLEKLPNKKYFARSQ